MKLVQKSTKEIVTVEDLCSLRDFAERHDIPVKRVFSWHDRSTSTRFPHPLYSYGNVKVFSYTEVKAWWDAWTLTRRDR